MKAYISSAYDQRRASAFELASFDALRASAAVGNCCRLVSSAEEAEIVLYADTGGMPELIFLSRVIVPRGRLAATYLYSENDYARGAFPGLYTSIPASAHKPDWTRGAPYIRPNVWLDGVAPLAWPDPPSYLFTFSGSVETHPVRGRLVSALREQPGMRPISRSDVQSAFERVDERGILKLRERAIEMSRQSHFVLCPRGQGASSIRLFETMQMGRSPVIVSDDWVEPAGPDWSSFAVRVPEDAVASIPALLEPMRGRSREMGAAARRAWEDWFSPEVCSGRLIDACLSIRASGANRKLSNHVRRWFRLLQPSELQLAARWLKSQAKR